MKRGQWDGWSLKDIFQDESWTIGLSSTSDNLSYERLKKAFRDNDNVYTSKMRKRNNEYLKKHSDEVIKELHLDVYSQWVCFTRLTGKNNISNIHDSYLLQIVI